MGITIFTPAPFPPDERQRSDAAKRSGLLNRVGDPDLTQIATRTRDATGADWCGVTLIVDETMHVIASSGGLIGMYRRSTSLCSYMLADPDPVFVILSAPADERFAGNPFVDDGIIDFFAGAVIRDPAGYPIGALCITDRTPRDAFSPEEGALLRDFANGITATIA